MNAFQRGKSYGLFIVSKARVRASTVIKTALVHPHKEKLGTRLLHRCTLDVLLPPPEILSPPCIGVLSTLYFSSNHTQNAGFRANLPPDGWAEEEMHVPGVVIARQEIVGTSPTIFTIDLFGWAPAVLQVTADKLSLFPMEGDLDSARSAVTHGLRPEKVSAYIVLGRYEYVVEGMIPCTTLTPIPDTAGPATTTSLFRFCDVEIKRNGSHASNTRRDGRSNIPVCCI